MVQIFAVIRFSTNYIPAYCSFFTCCLMSRLVALRYSSYNSRSRDCLHDLLVIPSIPVRQSLSEGSEPRRFSFELNFWFKKTFLALSASNNRFLLLSLYSVFKVQWRATFSISIKSFALGGDKRDRTADPLLAKQVLSQLSYTPISL